MVTASARDVLDVLSPLASECRFEFSISSDSAYLIDLLARVVVQSCTHWYSVVLLSVSCSCSLLLLLLLSTMPPTTQSGPQPRLASLCGHGWWAQTESRRSPAKLTKQSCVQAVTVEEGLGTTMHLRMTPRNPVAGIWRRDVQECNRDL